MPKYQYRVVAAPDRGKKAKGIKSNEGRFAHALEDLMNDMAGDGWEYQRAETLPSVERSGLTSTTTAWRNVLVFRKPVDLAGQQPEQLAIKLSPSATVPEEAISSDANDNAAEEDGGHTRPQHPDDDASNSRGAKQLLKDNGVEDVSDVAGMTNSLKRLASFRTKEKSSG